MRAAGLLALMGVFDLVGTTGAGWLSDRWSSRRLLGVVLRPARAVAVLPAVRARAARRRGLWVFAVWYGLDWIATVPPTLRLATDAFGAERAPIMFGWIGAGHQIGAALTAFSAGWIRTTLGDYQAGFLGVGRALPARGGAGAAGGTAGRSGAVRAAASGCDARLALRAVEGSRACAPGDC